MSENPPAFPTGNQQEWGPDTGMTLRDWFAGQALVGFAAGLVTNADNGGLAHPRASARVSFTDLAKDAFTVADAMIAERSN